MNAAQRNEAKKWVRDNVPTTSPEYDELMFGLMFNDDFDLADFSFETGATPAIRPKGADVRDLVDEMEDQ